MTKIRYLLGTIGIATVLGACAPYDPYSNGPSYQSQPASGPYAQPYDSRGSVVQSQRYAANTGVVASIETIRGRESSVSPVGAIIGAVVGGVLGNQIGAGSGKAAATGVGVVGGALAGNAIGQRTSASPGDFYRIGIQYDNGGYQNIDVHDPGDLRRGDRVRVDGGQISRY